MQNQDGVILLHGIFRSRRSMRKLENFLDKSGLQVLNLSYPSTKHKLENLADIIHPEIARFAASIAGRLHFVGYSMGGLLIRAYLQKHRPTNLGRVVLIAAPNKGSEIADLLKNFYLYKKLYGPAGQQLITEQHGFQNIFIENPDFEIGTIAGNKSIDPISSYIIGAPNDGKVSITSSQLINSKDHITIPSSHTFFPTNKLMWHKTLNFLLHGKF